MDRGVIIFTELAFGSIMFFVTDTIKKLAEEDAVLKQLLADWDAYIEEMEAKLRNLSGDLFAPSSERSPCYQGWCGSPGF